MPRTSEIALRVRLVTRCTRRLGLSVCVLLAAAALAVAERSPAPTEAQVQQRVEALLEQMTLAEKIGQLTQIGAYDGGDEGPKAEDLIRSGQAGSVLWTIDSALIQRTPGRKRAGSASRPRRELKGFERVTLAPGERRTVRFALGPAERRFWSAEARSWVVEPEAFDVWVGGDSQATLHGEFQVQP